jgi:hypothetical protein
VSIDGKPLEKGADGTPSRSYSSRRSTKRATSALQGDGGAEDSRRQSGSPRTSTIGWDEGKSRLRVKLKEIITRPVPLLSDRLQARPGRLGRVPKHSVTLAMKDVLEGPKRAPATQITKLQPGTVIDTLAISPDGQNLVFSILFSRSTEDLRSQLVVVRADGSGGADFYSDSKSLDIMPSYTAAAMKSSTAPNRAGNGSACGAMSATGVPGITQLTTGDTNDLWPMVDVDPKQRLYYQALVDTRSDPRLYMTQRGATIRKDLTHISGTQPRVSPKADAVIFCAMNEKTGKRDLYR